MKKFLSQVIHKISLEAIAWLGGLSALALMSPDSTQHYSFCVFKNLGFNYCPGCGLGHSISYFLHGDLALSWQAHPLGAVATIILVSRAFSLLRMNFVRSKGATVKSK
jgi:hypothetical protein